MIKGLILDLDQTLVDSSIATEARRCRDWQRVYSLIPSFKVYQGIYDALNVARSKGLRIAIVSTSPRPYVLKVLSYHRIPADCIIGYHDASRPKPSPEPMLEALRQMNLRSDEVLSFGDKLTDFQSSRSASIPFVACTWGGSEFQRVGATFGSRAVLDRSEQLSRYIQQNS
jgi:phosphoglycolate phosphatase-like HAD superfamily hydrolase